MKAENSREQPASVDLVRPLVGTAAGNAESERLEINGLDVQANAGEPAVQEVPEEQQSEEEDLFDFDWPGPGTPVANVEVENGMRVPEELEIPDDMAEEGRAAVGVRVPASVSKAQKEEHELTHCPYRAWCSICVKARGQKMPHNYHKDEDADENSKVPRASMDYFFMSKKDQDAKENPIVVIVNEETNERYARATGQKGIGTEGVMDWLIRDVSEELKSWGHAGGTGGKIIFKCDGEPAMVALRDAVAKFHGGIVIPETSAKGESQSNGAAESAGRLVREFTRVFKILAEESGSGDTRHGPHLALGSPMGGDGLLEIFGRCRWEDGMGETARPKMQSTSLSIWGKSLVQGNSEIQKQKASFGDRGERGHLVGPR